MGLRMLLRNWNDFAAKPKFGIFLKFFCGIEVGLRIFLSEENFCLKKGNGERELDLE